MLDQQISDLQKRCLRILAKEKYADLDELVYRLRSKAPKRDVVQKAMESLLDKRPDGEPGDRGRLVRRTYLTWVDPPIEAWELTEEGYAWAGYHFVVGKGWVEKKACPHCGGVL